MSRRPSPKTDKSEAPMSKKSSAALAEPASNARTRQSASHLTADEEPARAPDAEDESEEEIDVAPKAGAVAEGELVVLEEEFEFEDAAAEVEEGDEVVAPVKKKV